MEDDKECPDISCKSLFKGPGYWLGHETPNIKNFLKFSL
jgi:hypothetical protein